MSRNTDCLRWLALLAATLCGPGLTAQTASISPKGAAFDGGSNYVVPYSWYPTRYQQIYDHDSFSHGKTVLRISEVAYRLVSYRRGNTAATTSEVTLSLAYAAKGIDSTNSGIVFDRNVDLSTKKLCLSRKKVSMPSIKDASFGFVLKFDSNVSFVYDPSKKRSLVLEVLKWDGYGNSSYLIDAVIDDQKGAGTTRAYAYESRPGYGDSRQLWACRTEPYTSAMQLDHHTWRITTWVQPTRPLPAVLLVGNRLINSKAPGMRCALRVFPLVILPTTPRSSGHQQAELRLPRLPTATRFHVQSFAMIPNAMGTPELGGTVTCVTGTGLTSPTPPNALRRAWWLHRNRGHVTAFR